MINKQVKFFKFEHSEGAEIVIAESGKQAIKYFMDYYIDDLQINDIIEFGGLNITELTKEEINKKHKIFNEEKCILETISYQEILMEDGVLIPSVIVSPNY